MGRDIWQWLTIVGFVPLLINEHYFFLNKKKFKNIHIFFHVYLSFFIWNALSTWWILNATIIGALLAIILNSLFQAIVFWIAHIVKRNTSTKLGFIALIVFWLSFEYIHLNWELSWPWLTLGNGLSEQVAFIQWYEYTGVLGGSLWVLLISTMLSSINIQWIIDAYVKRKLIFAFLFITFFPILFSLYRYHSYAMQGNPLKVAVIQPNIDPYNDKFSGMTEHQQLERFFYLTDKTIIYKPDYIIGPETAIPAGFWEEDTATHEHILLFKSYAQQYSTSFIIGASTYRMFDTKESPTMRSFDNKYYEAYNTALQIDSHRIQFYRKMKLVLGVEKMPFPNILGFLEDFAIKLGGTSGSLGTEKEPKSLFGKTIVAPAICYESIYGEHIGQFIQKGAQWISVITNDGWWKDTPGYKQHLSYSRILAIETRKDIARSANTGISAFINQRGDIVKHTSWWKPEFLVNNIYGNNIKTFYVTWEII